MGTLNDTPVWRDGVRHFDANAVLTGGPDCPDNLPIQDLADRTAYLKAQFGSLIPAGTVLYVSSSSAPAGFLKANGAAVSREAYAALFSAIGTTFGAGDGATTFNLPDLRGEFVRGWDDGRGVDSARVFGSAQADDFKAHTHTQNIGGTVSNRYTTVTTSGPGDDSRNTGSTGGTETRPRNVALLFCIKY